MGDISWLGGVVALLGALGAGGLLSKWYDRRNATRDRRDEKSEKLEHEASNNNTEVLRTLLNSLQSQMDNYKSQLEDMRQRIVEQDRKIHDLELTNRRYEAGQIVAPGYALVPVPHLADIRAKHPGVLPSYDYPGESGIATVVPINPESNERRKS